MKRTFDIRFARHSGLAALFEASTNSFRWKGPGRLRIEDQWLVFVRSRFFSWPFARLLHRIPTAALSSVYREGDSLRLEFGGSPQLVVPIWARDRAEAAEIVRLVPTDRTVEVDRAEARPTSPSGRGSRLIWVALGMVIGGVLTMALMRHHYPAADALIAPDAGSSPSVSSVARFTSEPVPASNGSATGAVPEGERRGSPIPSTRPTDAAPPLEAGADGARMAFGTSGESANRDAPLASYVLGEPYVAIAPPRSDFFRAEALALRSDYIYGRTPPADLVRRWWGLSERLYNTPEFDDVHLRTLVDAQLGVSLNWRASLVNYEEALGSGDRARIEAARTDLEAASELTDRVVKFDW
jgi:hypothetical protein